MQFGARLEVGFHDGSINAIGFVSLDALIQFVPFHFEVDFAVGFQVRRNELNLVGVKVKGTISGPGPVTVTGRFCIEILFWDICWSHTFTIGSASPPAIVPVGSIAQALQGELSRPANLSVLGGDDPYVAVALRGTPSGVVLPPIGVIAWTQSRVPLGVPLVRFEGQPLATSQSMRVTASTLGGGPVQDWFSPGSFAELSQAESLTRPSFERLDAGLLLGFQEDHVAGVDHPYTVIEIRIPNLPRPGSFSPSLRSRCRRCSRRTADGQVRTRAPRWTSARSPSWSGATTAPCCRRLTASPRLPEGRAPSAARPCRRSMSSYWRGPDGAARCASTPRIGRGCSRL